MDNGVALLGGHHIGWPDQFARAARGFSEQKTGYQVRIGNKRFTERDGIGFLLSERRVARDLS